MKKNVKFLPYIFLFLIVLLWNLIIYPTSVEEIWNYGFAHNIFSGLVPYRDFKMIVTPLYSMFMSIPFHLFESNMLIFHITQALLVTAIFIVIFKLFSKQAWLIILLFFLPLPNFLPNQNWLLMFLFVVILYLEINKSKNDENDILIGFLLGLSILTNQIVGLFLLLPTILYFTHPKKVVMRIVGCIIPIITFLIYLITTGSLESFKEICLGSFSNLVKDVNLFNLFTLFLVGIILLTLRLIKNDPKDIKNYYGLAFYTVMFPYFDYQYFQLCLIVFAIILFSNFTAESNTFKYSFFTSGIIILMTVLGLIMFLPGSGFTYPNNINHFEFRFIPKKSIDQTLLLNKFLEAHEGEDIVFVNSNAYYFKLINNLKIDHLDILNKNYWGKDGDEKILNSIKVRKNSLFIINRKETNDGKQIDKDVVDYILKNGTRVEKVGVFDIYIMN